MIGKKFSFKGVQFPYTAQEGRVAGWYGDVTWKNISTRTTVIDRKNYHGAFASPTLAGSRLITVSGEIFSADKTQRGLIRKTLDSMFVLEGTPRQGGGLYPLQIMDDDGSEWQIMAQVYTMPDYTNERGSPVINFSVELLAPDPMFYSTTTQDVYGIYGLFGGIALPTVLPTTLGEGVNILAVHNAGNFASAPVITITGDIVNPKIIQLNTGLYWKQLRTLSTGDTLVLDTKAQTAVYNGVDDITNRGAGSSFLFVQPTDNYFILTGDDFDYDDQSKAQFHISFSETML